MSAPKTASHYATADNLKNEKASLGALASQKTALTEEFPTIFHLDITGMCNLSCTYCQRDFFVKTNHPFIKGNMPQEVFDAVLPYFKGARVVALLSMLGEPLIVKELPRWWQAILDSGAKPQTTTNGILLTPDLADMFTRLGGRLKISIDSFDQGELDIMRPRMKADLLRDRLKLIAAKRAEHRNEKFQLGLNICVTTANVQSLVDTMEESLKYGRVDVFTFANFRLPRDSSGQFHESARSLSLDLDNDATKSSWQRILKWAEKRSREDGIKFVFPYTKVEWKHLLDGGEPPKLGETSFEDTELKDVNYYCCVPWMKVHVLSNGDVIPCSLLYWPQPELKMGNLLESSFKDIWHGEKFAEFRKKMSGGKNYPFCGECKSWWKFYTPERVD